MMDGVEILSTETIYCTEYYSWPFWIIGILTLIITTAVFVYNYMENDIFESILNSFLSICVCFLLLIIPAVVIAAHDTDEILYFEHKAIISDDVSMNEFMNNYEIIEREDKLYIIREYPNE